MQMSVLQIGSLFLILFAVCQLQSTTKKPLSAYTDADFEKLYDQWEDNDDEKLSEDELPPWKRPKPAVNVDLKKMKLDSPEELLKVTKRGQTMMMFAKITGTRSDEEANDVAQIWQDGLFNAHIEVKRYMIAADKVLFVISDGAVAWRVKEFLVKQPHCEKVTIDGRDFPGAGASNKSGNKKDEL